VAYSFDSSQAGPDQCSPPPVVFSTSQGALASTATRSTPAFLMASMRGLLPCAGTSCASADNAVAATSARLATSAFSPFMIVLPLLLLTTPLAETPERDKVVAAADWAIRAATNASSSHR
jgi:hypothetical protein